MPAAGRDPEQMKRYRERELARRRELTQRRAEGTLPAHQVEMLEKANLRRRETEQKRRERRALENPEIIAPGTYKATNGVTLPYLNILGAP